eukprot:TRINITY_DN56872_c0_g1_i1.p1 TRINITY_DN56872_c0_g1~~TRINITY_DN56872_c0_g1_i1.p1  ORF type:complete len:601 (+),score=115.81 TRINITY_DN56872_c0_g1_i1:55-1857(+)
MAAKGLNPDHGERARDQGLDTYERLIRTEMASRQRQLEDAKRARERQKEDRTGVRPLVGKGLLPREQFRMTDVSQIRDDYSGACFWGMAHSWQGMFGLYGHGEQQETLVRGLLSTTCPPIMLMELNSRQTFNMMDVELCTDFMFMMDAFSMLMKQKEKRHLHPLAGILQGQGPHFCPGGNHHPVAPPGATQWSMCTRSANSSFLAQVKSLGIPTITAITGNAIGGGVAQSLNCTERVGTQNGSAAFGNISRGACPIGWLSMHLPKTVGLAAAMDVYLNDLTLSAAGVFKAGLTSRVCPDNKSTKATAFEMAVRMASHPYARLSAMVQSGISIHRFNHEANGLFLCSQMGQMVFPGVKKEANKKVASETIAVEDFRKAIRGPRAAKPGGQQRMKGKLRQDSASDAEDEADDAAEGCAEPQPFPSTTGHARPVQLPQAAAQAAGISACARCGDQGSSGTAYGGRFFCDRCWPSVRAGASQPEGMVCARCGDSRDLFPDGTSYQCRMCGPGVGLVAPGGRKEDGNKLCATCGACSPALAGRHGGGAYSSHFYCNGCWRKWEAWPAKLEEPPTDIGTDHSHDSGTEGTILDSDRACFTSGSDME